MGGIRVSTVCEINMCAGCMSCKDICPRNAITIKDSLKAYNAAIDENLCINCNACHNMCQSNHRPTFRAPVYWKQGWAKDKSIREHSSSGGFATALELAFVRQGGVVCSCTFQDGDFVFILAETGDDIHLLTGSKYVKSNTEGIYKKIKNKLQSKTKVLFVGLPCQVAAVLNYCGAPDDLYTIDLICHGSPSPKLLSMYLRENQIHIEDIKDISFRNKTNFKLMAGKRRLTHPRISDYYTSTFLNGTTYTENCYSCNYARMERVSDLTLGDSWGSELTKEEQEKGISLLLAQTEKGIQLVKTADIELIDVSIDLAIANNHQLQHPSMKNSARETFFKELEKGSSFSKAYIKSFPDQHRKENEKKVLIALKLLREDKA